MKFAYNGFDKSGAKVRDTVEAADKAEAIESLRRRLSAAGYAEYRPVATNSTREGRSMNRRVDIVILSETLSSTSKASPLQ